MFQVEIRNKAGEVKTFKNILAKDEVEATQWGEVQAEHWKWKGVGVKVSEVKVEVEKPKKKPARGKKKRE